jgi:hypothetical protein
MPPQNFPSVITQGALIVTGHLSFDQARSRQHINCGCLFPEAVRHDHGDIHCGVITK